MTTPLQADIVRRSPKGVTAGVLVLLSEIIVTFADHVLNDGTTERLDLALVALGDHVAWITADVTVVFDGTAPSGTIGDGTDDDGYMDAAQLAVTALGGKLSTEDAQPFSKIGKAYLVDDTVELVWALDTATTGSMVIRTYGHPNE